jgi:hypothetical protein
MAAGVSTHSEQYRIMLGSQLKQAYDVIVTTGDIVDVARAPAQPAAGIYADALPALLLLVDPMAKFASKQLQGVRSSSVVARFVYIELTRV